MHTHTFMEYMRECMYDMRASAQMWAHVLTHSYPIQHRQLLVHASKTKKMVKMVTPLPCAKLGHTYAHDAMTHTPTSYSNHVYDALSRSFYLGKFGSKHIRICFPYGQYNWPKCRGFVQVMILKVV